jgi:hypothetical protein
MQPLIQMGPFAGASIEIFEIKGSEGSGNAKSKDFIWISMRSWLVIAWGKGKGATQRTKVSELVTEKDLCGLEAPELT